MHWIDNWVSVATVYARKPNRNKRIEFEIGTKWNGTKQNKTKFESNRIKCEQKVQKIFKTIKLSNELLFYSNNTLANIHYRSKEKGKKQQQKLLISVLHRNCIVYSELDSASTNTYCLKSLIRRRKYNTQIYNKNGGSHWIFAISANI